MALEAVVYSQDLFSYTMNQLCSLGGGVWGYDFGGAMEEEEEEKCAVGGGVKGQQHANWGSSCGSLVHNFQEWDVNSSSPDAGCFPAVSSTAAPEAASGAAAGRRKRRRVKKCKNKDEVESQRMTHIAVERNRRKQMNEYLAVLRSLMPPSYAQRGDQASIIGGAINFVKELEHLLQSLQAQKQTKQAPEMGVSSSPFADFFTFPQYSSCSSSNTNSTGSAADGGNGETMPGSRSAVADIEVTMVESHANLKVLTKRRPRQLLKMVVGLQNLRLTTLHLNVSTAADQMALYSFSLKVEDDCPFSSVDEIAAAVHAMIGEMEREEAGVVVHH